MKRIFLDFLQKCRVFKTHAKHGAFGSVDFIASVMTMQLKQKQWTISLLSTNLLAPPRLYKLAFSTLMGFFWIAHLEMNPIIQCIHNDELD